MGFYEELAGNYQQRAVGNFAKASA